MKYVVGFFITSLLMVVFVVYASIYPSFSQQGILISERIRLDEEILRLFKEQVETMVIITLYFEDRYDVIEAKYNFLEKIVEGHSNYIKGEMIVGRAKK